MVVTVFGLGFVGLTTALGFADKGIKVYGIDVNKERSDMITSGKLPFYEPGMDIALKNNLNKTFFTTRDITSAISQSDCVYYCVGTPYGNSGRADLTYLFNAIDQTLNNIHDSKFRVLVTKSTIPPSTTLERLIPYVESKGYKSGTDLGIANNPEFLREGHCWEDFTNADRIVLGCNDKRSEEILRKLYSAFATPIFTVSLNTGEFIKYLSNSLLATMISYANEMSLIADSIGEIDIAKAFHILHLDRRWGGCNMASYVYPGCGYGGYCLPKDTNALYAQSREKGYDPQILKNVIEVNNLMPAKIADKITKDINDRNTAIGILGLAFKPGSDDVRDTPAAKIIEILIDRGFSNIYAYDPVATLGFAKHYGLSINYCTSVSVLYKKCKVVAITTDWTEFSNITREFTGRVIDCRYFL